MPVFLWKTLWITFRCETFHRQIRVSRGAQFSLSVPLPLWERVAEGRVRGAARDGLPAAPAPSMRQDAVAVICPSPLCLPAHLFWRVGEGSRRPGAGGTGRRPASTGGAKRNPWNPCGGVLAPAGRRSSGAVKIPVRIARFRRPAGAEKKTKNRVGDASFPRVPRRVPSGPRRSTRGYSPSPRRGEKTVWCLPWCSNRAHGRWL